MHVSNDLGFGPTGTAVGTMVPAGQGPSSGESYFSKTLEKIQLADVYNASIGALHPPVLSPGRCSTSRGAPLVLLVSALYGRSGTLDQATALVTGTPTFDG